MTILTTTYNCELYIEKCLQSISNQTFKNFKCYITDDLSTDNTVGLIERFVANDNRFILIKNEVKHFQTGNYDQVIRKLNLPDEEICVEVDGDDWLSDDNVLERINDVYKDDSIWMTSGSFRYHDGRPGFANPPVQNVDVRKQNFTLSHLRTWKSWLWKKINEEDLKDVHGNYWGAAGDLSFMYPMFEMSGPEHFRFLSDINYIYNESNPINEHKVYMNKVNSIVHIIRGKKPYDRIK